MPRSTVFDDCMLCVRFHQAAALLELGSASSFINTFFGLLKRANYAKQNKHIEKCSSHLHKYHGTSWLCGMNGLVCRPVYAVSQNSSIPGPPRSRTCTDPGKKMGQNVSSVISPRQLLLLLEQLCQDRILIGRNHTEKDLS